MNRTKSNAAAGTMAIVAMLAVAACGKKDETPPPSAPTPAGTYPATGAYPPATAYPTATAPMPAAGGMATPGPLALPCQSDASCGLAHCNVQFQKCAFPCASAVDCIQGAACNAMTGLCLPGGGQ